MGIEQLHHEHLDAFIFAGMTWEEYSALPATFHAGRTTWWRRKRALIAEGKPVKMDRELIKEAASQVGKDSRSAPRPATGSSEADLMDVRDNWYESYLLNAARVLPNQLFPLPLPYSEAPIQTVKVSAVSEGHVKEVCIVPLLDRHLIRWASDLPSLVQITREIMRTRDLYLCVLGDIENLLTGLRRNFARYARYGQYGRRDNKGCGQPEHELLDRWLSWIAPRVLFVTSRAGTIDGEACEKSYVRSAVDHHWQIVTCDPFGRVNIKVGSQEYHLAVSRSLRGYTLRAALHKTIGALKHATAEPELILLEGTRSTGTLSYSEGGWERLILACGKDALVQQGIKGIPCFSLDGSSHRITPFLSVGSWIDASSVG